MEAMNASSSLDKVILINASCILSCRCMGKSSSYYLYTLIIEGKKLPQNKIKVHADNYPPQSYEQIKLEISCIYFSITNPLHHY